MVEWNWDNIVSLYTGVKLPVGVSYDPTIRELENRMLDLLARIKKSPCILKCKPGAAHQILTLRPPGAHSTIHVIWDRTGYEIALDPFGDSDPSQQERMLVAPEDVVSMLEDYVKRLEV